jgi:hypothetical protein
MKRSARKKARREIFVLTPEEKRIVCFVVVLFFLGLGTKHYRTAHLPASLKTEVKSNAAAPPNSAQPRVDEKARQRPK